jgi:transcriptional regulator with XRE-family HTH domain
MSKRKQEEPDPIDLAVGANIKGMRVRRGMSQKVLAGEIDLTFQQIQKYESGKNRVSASVLVKIARALGVHVSLLFNSVEALLANPSGDEALADSAESHYGTDENMVAAQLMQIRDQKVKKSLADLIKHLSETL